MSTPSRQVSVVAWAGLVATPVLFGAVTAVVVPPRDMRSPELAQAFLWISAAVVGLGLAVARLLPPLIRARHQGSREAVAFVRLAVAWAIREGAAMFPLVAELVTGNRLLYLVSAVPLLAMISLYPTEERWRGQAVQPSADGPGSFRGGRP